MVGQLRGGPGTVRITSFPDPNHAEFFLLDIIPRYVKVTGTCDVEDLFGFFKASMGL